MNLTRLVLSFILISIVCTPGVYSNEISREYKTAPGFVRIVTNMLGYNSAAKFFAQKSLKRELRKNIQGKLNIRIDSFSGVDLKKGKFQSLKIKGKELCLDNELYLSKLCLQTTPGFYYVDYRKNPVVFKTDLPLNYSIIISEDDLNKTMESNTLLNEISEVIPLVHIDNFKFKLENDKIIMFSAFHFPFGKSVRFSVSVRPKLENGKIILSDMKTFGAGREVPEKIVSFLNGLNLAENIKISILKGVDSTLYVENLLIADKKISINGVITIKRHKS